MLRQLLVEHLAARVQYESLLSVLVEQLAGIAAQKAELCGQIEDTVQLAGAVHPGGAHLDVALAEPLGADATTDAVG